MPDELAGYDFADLAVQVTADTQEDAFERVQPTLEAVIDGLSFQMQELVPLIALDCVDVTSPLRIGEERSIWIEVNPQSTVMAKFSTLHQSDFGWQTASVSTPTLQGGSYTLDRTTRKALWWYVKSLSVPWVLDRFSCLSTALDLLSASDDRYRVVEPTKTPCGHEVPKCPSCGEDTRRPRGGGARYRRYLEAAGVSSDEAKSLWNLRQAVHGRDVFTQVEMGRMARASNTLRAVVLAAIKQALGDAPERLPLMVRQSGPSLGRQGLGGHRAIEQSDIDTAAEHRTLLNPDAPAASDE